MTPEEDTQIDDFDNVRDLGIIMSQYGDYNAHIDYICKKVRKRIGWILRSFNSRQPHFLRIVWKTYIGPIIDYCGQLYCPTSGVQLQKLENLLKSYTKKADGLYNLNYWKRLESMKMSSIGRRFERYRILYSWKVITGKTDNCGLTTLYNPLSGTTIDTINVDDYSKSQREQSFHYSAPCLFNILPRYLRDMTEVTLDTWKDSLDKLLSLVPDQPHTVETIPGLCKFHTSDPFNSLLHWLPYLKLNNRRREEINSN